MDAHSRCAQESFQPFGFTRYMFSELLQHAERVTLKPGEYVFKQGTEMKYGDYDISTSVLVFSPLTSLLTSLP